MTLLVTLALQVSLVAARGFFGSVWADNDANFGKFFTQTTPENAGKWGAAEPNQGQFNWGPLDNMFNGAKTKNVTVKQHNFVWGQQQPGWVNTNNAKAAVTAWITAFMNRYGNQVAWIDVVNEPLHAVPSYSSALGGGGATGWDWVIWVYQEARRLAPRAKLLINDYNIINSASATNNYYNLCKLLKDRNLLDGIGEQGHFYETTDLTLLKSNLDHLGSLGLPIVISEMDIDIADDNNQRARYQTLFPLFWEHPNVQGITLWGYRQGIIWRTNAFLVRSDNSERPALTWLRTYLQQHPPSANHTDLLL